MQNDAIVPDVHGCSAGLDLCLEVLQDADERVDGTPVAVAPVSGRRVEVPRVDEMQPCSLWRVAQHAREASLKHSRLCSDAIFRQPCVEEMRRGGCRSSPRR